MAGYLTDHALKNIWCTPDQDNQYIVQPQRITPRDGVFTSFKVMRRALDLPTKHERYHLFQVGNCPPVLLGLLGLYRPWLEADWATVSEAMIGSDMLCDIYTREGVHIPRFDTYYCYNNRKDLIFAIKENSKIPINFSLDKIYIRVYSNAYFNRNDVTFTLPKMYTEGRTVKSLEDRAAVISTFTTYSEKSGLTYAYINGLFNTRVDALTVQVGDVVDIVYDSSVAKTIVFDVGSLSSYLSTLDNMRKYILHYPDDATGTIEYYDDNELFITRRINSYTYSGVHFHRNSTKSMRMLSHRDYGIAIPHYVYLGEQLQRISQTTLTLSDFKLFLFIRKSGYDRPLVYDDYRIKELYKLEDANIRGALNGVDSTVPFWTAAALEESAYCQVMRSNYDEITQDLVDSAYGYNAISKLVGDTPTLLQTGPGNKQFDLPVGLQSRATAFEYDADGYLTGSYLITESGIYTTQSASTRLVEVLYGHGTYVPDVVFGENNLSVAANVNYRVYRCYQTINGLDNQWVDVTDTDYYTIENGVFVWTHYDPNAYFMIRTNSTFLNYELSFLPVDGNLRFTLSEREDRGNSVENFTLPIPLGELDIFLNGKSLIPNIDYYVNFPEVCIVNKEYLTENPNTTAQTIRVRYTGFCQSDLKVSFDGDVGFVQYGMLSNNNRFDIRDDKVLRITVDGSLYDRSELLFRETDSAIVVPDPSNGKPYYIKDIVVPIDDFTNTDTYIMRARSQIKDRIVSDYLTLKKPITPPEELNVIPERYQVFSPFICKLIYLLINEVITTESLMVPLTDTDILTRCRPYEDWLAFDPIYGNNHPGTGYVIVHPLNINATLELNLFQYRFIHRVVGLYANGLVDLSLFIQLKPIS